MTKIIITSEDLLKIEKADLIASLLLKSNKINIYFKFDK